MEKENNNNSKDNNKNNNSNNNINDKINKNNKNSNDNNNDNNRNDDNNNDNNTIKITKGVLFSKKYNEYYKSTTLGLLESFYKFVIPSFEAKKEIENETQKKAQEEIEKKIKKNKDKINIKNKKKINNKNLIILDDCFGYGFNTLATIIYTKMNNINLPIQIYSFEKEKKIITEIQNIEKELISFLEETNYLEEIFPKKTIEKRKKTILDSINTLKKIKQDEKKNKIIYTTKTKNIKITIFNEDLNNINKIKSINTKEKIKSINLPLLKTMNKIKINKKNKIKFDFIYHDPFSKSKNPDAWTKKLFKKINKYTKENSLITSYSSNGEFRDCLRNLNYKITNIKPYGRKKPSTLARKEI